VRGENDAEDGTRDTRESGRLSTAAILGIQGLSGVYLLLDKPTASFGLTNVSKHPTDPKPSPQSHPTH
jgi:hypothetical protein